MCKGLKELPVIVLAFDSLRSVTDANGGIFVQGTIEWLLQEIITSRENKL